MLSNTDVTNVLCAFPVSICIPDEDVPSQSVKSPFPVRHIPILDEDVHSRWGTFLFSVRYILTSYEDVYSQ